LLAILFLTPAIAQIQNQPDDGQWPMAAKNYASTRFSTLDQINTGNVKNLKLAWTFSTGLTRGHEAAPLVVNNTMYIVTPFPNLLYALDLTKPGAPMKWVYEPKASPASQGVACCDVVNRGAAFYNGRIYYNTLDMYTVAVDADSGRIAWRAYHTGPDRDVLIGPNFKPFYSSERGQDLGVKTWQGETWKIGGSGAWGWISYDPDLELIYYGSANPSPWNPELRPGDNKWTATLFARRPATGEAIWAYQMNPHDLHYYDGVNDNVFVDLSIKGQMRKVLAHPDRNGRLHVVDRATGEVLSAEAYGNVNTSDSVDLKTGRLQVVEAKATGFKTVRDICPAAPGTKDWQPSAFSPRTNLLYIPQNNLCMEMEGVQANFIAGTPFVGANGRCQLYRSIHLFETLTEKNNHDHTRRRAARDRRSRG